jgi:tetratricopeptide (TPR) repeat protein
MKVAAVLTVLILTVPVMPALADPGGSPEQTGSEARLAYDQGMEYFRRAQWSLAIQAFLRAINLEPRFVEAWTNLGFSYRRAGDNQKALDAYRRALELRPDYKFAHAYVGRLYIAMGNREMAMRHYEILRRLDSAMAEELRRAIEAGNADQGKDAGGY